MVIHVSPPLGDFRNMKSYFYKSHQIWQLLCLKLVFILRVLLSYGLDYQNLKFLKYNIAFPVLK